MLTLRHILKVGDLIYQTETVRTGTFHGRHIPGCGPSDAYRAKEESTILSNQEPSSKGKLEERAKRK